MKTYKTFTEGMDFISYPPKVSDKQYTKSDINISDVVDKVLIGSTAIAYVIGISKKIKSIYLKRKVNNEIEALKKKDESKRKSWLLRKLYSIKDKIKRNKGKVTLGVLASLFMIFYIGVSIKLWGNYQREVGKFFADNMMHDGVWMNPEDFKATYNGKPFDVTKFINKMIKDLESANIK